MKKDIIAAAVILALTPVVMAGLGYILPTSTRGQIPAAVPYTPPADSAAAVRAFVRGDVDHVEEADLHAPSVSPALRAAAKNLMD